MSKFSAFMSANVAKIENKKIVVSNRFIKRDDEDNPILDENGKPIIDKWEIRAITTEENDDLQRRAMVSIPVPGQKGAYTREMDQIKYTAMMLAASVVYPDLNNAELQDDWGVKTPEALLKKILYPKEEAVLAQEVMSLSQVEDLGEAVQEAKN